MKKLHPKYLNVFFSRGAKLSGWNFPKAHDELSGNSVNLGLLGSSESSNSWPSTFFWREKVEGEALLEKGGRRHEATGHNRNPPSTYYFELQNSKCIVCKNAINLCRQSFWGRHASVFPGREKQPRKFGSNSQKQTLWIFSDKPLVSFSQNLSQSTIGSHVNRNAPSSVSYFRSVWVMPLLRLPWPGAYLMDQIWCCRRFWVGFWNKKHEKKAAGSWTMDPLLRRKDSLF